MASSKWDLAHDDKVNALNKVPSPRHRTRDCLKQQQNDVQRHKHIAKEKKSKDRTTNLYRQESTDKAFNRVIDDRFNKNIPSVNSYTSEYSCQVSDDSDYESQ